MNRLHPTSSATQILGPLVLVVSALLALLPLSAHADSAAPITWSATPSDQDGPDGRVSLRHEVDPGGLVTDFIAITNESAVPATFSVLPGDGVIGTGGAFDVQTDELSAAGGWVSLVGIDDDELALAAGETRVLPVTITVPADAAPGDHPAGIVVGLTSSEAGITVTHRVGVRLHLRVSGEVSTALTVEVTDSHYESSLNPFRPGVMRVTYEVTNTGNTRLAAATSVNAVGMFDLFPVALPAVEPVELLPATSSTHTVEFEAWPTVRISGAVEANPRVVGEDEVTLPAPAVAEFEATAVPWTIIVVAGVVLLGLVVLIRRRASSAVPRPVG